MEKFKCPCCEAMEPSDTAVKTNAGLICHECGGQPLGVDDLLYCTECGNVGEDNSEEGFWCERTSGCHICAACQTFESAKQVEEVD